MNSKNTPEESLLSKGINTKELVASENIKQLLNHIQVKYKEIKKASREALKQQTAASSSSNIDQAKEAEQSPRPSTPRPDCGV